MQHDKYVLAPLVQQLSIEDGAILFNGLSVVNLDVFWLSQVSPPFMMFASGILDTTNKASYLAGQNREHLWQGRITNEADRLYLQKPNIRLRSHLQALFPPRLSAGPIQLVPVSTMPARIGLKPSGSGAKPSGQNGDDFRRSPYFRGELALPLAVGKPLIFPGQ
ncbi:hypothetical protein [Arthrobacter sp. ISL-30]|uniref:hypothetical protein n=1 Tax=Arthrobacter sp. ISL-30 TaxID=2819109 RepID=UPI001BE6498D|nr:hypothetical protein [Arthrobacter sp. ISL-30]MBT2513729.1 hypothetical protein [Arthrobacter sp. ISL-30]